MESNGQDALLQMMAQDLYTHRTASSVHVRPELTQGLCKINAAFFEAVIRYSPVRE